MTKVEIVKTKDVDAVAEQSKQLRALAQRWRVEAQELQSRPLDGRSFLALVTDTVAASIDEARAQALLDAAEQLERLVGAAD